MTDLPVITKMTDLPVITKMTDPPVITTMIIKKDLIIVDLQKLINTQNLMIYRFHNTPFP
jgi:hypothetical protein